MGLLQRLRKQQKNGPEASSKFWSCRRSAGAKATSLPLASPQQAAKLAAGWRPSVRLVERPPWHNCFAPSRRTAGGYTGKLAGSGRRATEGAGASLLPTAPPRGPSSVAAGASSKFSGCSETGRFWAEIAESARDCLEHLRTHTKGIFGKLNVTNRRSAVKASNRAGTDLATQPRDPAPTWPCHVT